jgi:hypothetical protein
VPVSPSTSRRTQSNGISAGASYDFCSPLIVSVAMETLDPLLDPDIVRGCSLSTGQGT